MGLLGKLFGKEDSLDEELRKAKEREDMAQVGKLPKRMAERAKLLMKGERFGEAAEKYEEALNSIVQYRLDGLHTIYNKDVIREYEKLRDFCKSQVGSASAILTTSLILIIASIIVFSMNITGITGNVIGGLDKTTMSWIGIILFVLGIVILYCLRKKAKSCCDMGGIKKVKKSKKTKVKPVVKLEEKVGKVKKESKKKK